MLLFVKSNVYADNECTTKERQPLIIEANNVIVNYELVKPSSDMPGLDVYSYDFNIINMTENLYAKVGQFVYQQKKPGEDVFVEEAVIYGGRNVAVEIYGNENTACPDVLLRTIWVRPPIYNIYSDYEECKGYDYLDVCKSNTNTSSIDSKEEFVELLEQQKEDYEKALKKPQDTKEKKENPFYSYLNKHRSVVIIAVITLITLIVVVFIIFKKRKNKRIKIDIG